MATRFTKDGVGVMALQCAFRASEKDLVRAENRLSDLNKQRDADDHHQNRGELTANARQRYVSKAGRRDRCDGEVEGIDITVQPSTRSKEEGVDEARYNEQKRDQVH